MLFKVNPQLNRMKLQKQPSLRTPEEFIGWDVPVIRNKNYLPISRSLPSINPADMSSCETPSTESKKFNNKNILVKLQIHDIKNIQCFKLDLLFHRMTENGTERNIRKNLKL